MPKPSTLKVRVLELLTTSVSMRDNPEELLVAIWSQDIKAEFPYSLSIPLSSFFDKLKAHELTPPDNVFRMWRLVQENDEQGNASPVRGKTWYKRHNIKEPEYRETIVKYEDLPEPHADNKGQYSINV